MGFDLSSRKLLGLADKIAKLKDEDAEMINGYLKILKSDWRITKTEISQMKEMGSQAKKGLKKLKGLFE